MKLYKYQGAGNDFLIADNRDEKITIDNGVLSDGTATVKIADVCDRRYGVGADGLMLLENNEKHDFTMAYFNSDGSGGMMCGNGGRCIVAFAADCGIRHFDFEAADGFHTAGILSENGRTKNVRLKMKDVGDIKVYGDINKPASIAAEADNGLDGCFLDTGTRHFVMFSSKVSDIDVFNIGRKIRNREEFAPIGTNVNFVEQDGFSIKVRTYEKGVEDETFACGTGIVASSISAYYRLLSGKRADCAASEDGSLIAGGRVRFDVRAVRDTLAVDFLPGSADVGVVKVRGGESGGLCCPVAQDVWLTGPATFVAEIVL